MGDYEPLLRWQREPRGPNEVDRIDLSPPQPLLHYSPNTRSPYLPDYNHTPALDGFLGSPAFRPSRLSNSPGASVLFSPMDIDVSRSPSTPSIYQDNELVSPSPSLTALQPDQIGSPRWEGASYLVDLPVSEGTPIPPSISSSPLEVLADIQNNDIHDSPNSVYYTPLQSPLLGSPLTVAAPVLNGARTTAQIKKRRKQEVFICPIPGCGRTFSRNINLTVHIRLHKEEKPLVCRWPECGRGFSRYHDLQLHEQSHACLQSLECKGCRKIFTHVDALKQHLFSEEGTICLKLHVFLHLRRDGDGAGQDYAAQINQYINHISAESPDSRYASLTNLRDLRESICSMIIKIAGDRELRKQFIDVFSAQERRPEAQGISNCVNSILYEESFNNANDHANVLRLLCKFQGAAQVYPDRYLLSDISMAPLPFQGGGFADTFEGKHKDKRICIKMIRVFDKEPQVKLLKELARETTLWAHMSHENILPFYGTYVSDRATSRICLVSPFMKNGNLETFLRNNPTTPRLPLVRALVVEWDGQYSTIRPGSGCH
ncbi:Transcription factor Sp2 [Leucoagaricus sp. SymC.cos]|nr:Transcription factor Sp2 [Leucoagaricus sp. SymC.cos]